MEYEQCGYTGIRAKQKDLENLGLDKYNCPKYKNYSIQGTFYSDKFRYIQARLYRCQNTTTKNDCHSKEEIDKFILDEGVTLSLSLLNSYFDSKDFQNPIKYFIDDQFYWPIQTTINKKTNIYIKENEIYRQDSFLSTLLPAEADIHYQVDNF